MGVRDTIYTLLTEITKSIQIEQKDEFIEKSLNILIDQKNNESVKRSLISKIFDVELNSNENKNQDIKRTIDALVNGTRVLNELY